MFRKSLVCNGLRDACCEIAVGNRAKPCQIVPKKIYKRLYYKSIMFFVTNSHGLKYHETRKK